MLIRGDQLSPRQREQVLNAFVHRHLDTTSKSDAEWLRKHAFHFTKDGSRLMFSRRYAEPAWMAKGGKFGGYVRRCKYGRVRRGRRRGLCRIKRRK